MQTCFLWAGSTGNPQGLTGEEPRLPFAGVCLIEGCLRRAAEVVTQYFKEHEVLKVGTLRDLLKVNRRQALLILTYFDGLGLTVKAGDGRAAGSRAANDTAKGDDVYE